MRPTMHSRCVTGAIAGTCRADGWNARQHPAGSNTPLASRTMPRAASRVDGNTPARPPVASRRTAVPD
jgi:hypothetical protein